MKWLIWLIQRQLQYPYPLNLSTFQFRSQFKQFITSFHSSLLVQSIQPPSSSASTSISSSSSLAYRNEMDDIVLLFRFGYFDLLDHLFHTIALQIKETQSNAFMKSHSSSSIHSHPIATIQIPIQKLIQTYFITQQQLQSTSICSLSPTPSPSSSTSSSSRAEFLFTTPSPSPSSPTASTELKFTSFEEQLVRKALETQEIQLNFLTSATEQTHFLQLIHQFRSLHQTPSIQFYYSSSSSSFTPSSLDIASFQYYQALLQTPIHLNTSDITFALISKTQDQLLACIKSHFPQISWNWSVFQTLALPFWYKRETGFRELVERMLRQEYLASKDLDLCSIFYIALDKKQVLSGLYRVNKQTAVAHLLTNDFQQERWQNAAIKNAHVLRTQQRYQLAAAFFLLANHIEQALATSLLADPSFTLAITIARLCSAEQAFENLLKDRILPQAKLDKDVWMEFIVYWHLNQQQQAIDRLLKVECMIRLNQCTLQKKKNVSYLWMEMLMKYLDLEYKNCTIDEEKMQVIQHLRHLQLIDEGYGTIAFHQSFLYSNEKMSDKEIFCKTMIEMEMKMIDKHNWFGYDFEERMRRVFLYLKELVDMDVKKLRRDCSTYVKSISGYELIWYHHIKDNEDEEDEEMMKKLYELVDEVIEAIDVLSTTSFTLSSHHTITSLFPSSSSVDDGLKKMLEMNEMLMKYLITHFQQPKPNRKWIPLRMLTATIVSGLTTLFLHFPLPICCSNTTFTILFPHLNPQHQPKEDHCELLCHLLQQPKDKEDDESQFEKDLKNWFELNQSFQAIVYGANKDDDDDADECPFKQLFGCFLIAAMKDHIERIRLLPTEERDGMEEKKCFRLNQIWQSYLNQHLITQQIPLLQSFIQASPFTFPSNTSQYSCSCQASGDAEEDDDEADDDGCEWQQLVKRFPYDDILPSITLLIEKATKRFRKHVHWGYLADIKDLSSPIASPKSSSSSPIRQKKPFLPLTSHSSSSVIEDGLAESFQSEVLFKTSDNSNIRSICCLNPPNEKESEDEAFVYCSIKGLHTLEHQQHPREDEEENQYHLQHTFTDSIPSSSPTPPASSSSSITKYTTVEAHPSSAYIAAGTSKGGIQFYDVQSHTAIASFEMQGKAITRIRFGNLGKQIGACNYGKGDLALWQFSAQDFHPEPYAMFKCHNRGTKDFTFLNSTSSVASVGASTKQENLCLWDVLLPPSKALIASPTCHTGGASSLVFSARHQVSKMQSA